MQTFVFGQTSGTVTVSSGSLEDVLTLDLPGDQLNPQDWVFVCCGEVAVFDGAAATDIRSDVRVTLNGTDQYLYQYMHQNAASVNSRTGFFSVFFIKDHCGFLTGGSHQRYSTIKIRAAHNTTDSATGQVDLTNCRIFGIRVTKNSVGNYLYHTKTGNTAFNGTGSAIYGEASFTPTRGKYLVLSSAQVTLDDNAVPGTADFKFVVAETKDASNELGATTLELRRTPHVDLNTGSAALGHITHQEHASVVQKIVVSACAVVDLWDTPTSCSWLIDFAGTSASSQIENCVTVALPLDGNFEYALADYCGSRSNATTSYSRPVTAFTFGRGGKRSFLLYSAYATKTAAGDLDAAVFPTGSSSGAHGSVFAQTLPAAYETLYLSGVAMFSGPSAGVDFAFRENTASGGDAVLNNCVFLALTDAQSGQTDAALTYDFPMPYDVEAFESANPVDAATEAALHIVARSAAPVGVSVKPIVFATDARTTAISITDTLLNF